MNGLLKKNVRLSGFALKRIAVVSMLIDHFGSIVMDGVLAPYQNDGMIFFTADMPFLIRNAFHVKAVCEALGSVAFPIFCFLCVQGFLHTHDRLRYGLRMGVFALLSEIPYNVAHYGALTGPRLQNVMFTLCTGIFTLLAVVRAQERFAESRGKQIAAVMATTLAGMTAAFLIRGEYVFLGVLSIVLLYLLRGCGRLSLLGFAPLLAVSPWILLALPPAYLYSGERGKGSQMFFYFFYPAHFLALAGISFLLAAR